MYCVLVFRIFCFALGTCNFFTILESIKYFANSAWTRKIWNLYLFTALDLTALFAATWFYMLNIYNYVVTCLELLSFHNHFDTIVYNSWSLWLYLLVCGESEKLSRVIHPLIGIYSPVYHKVDSHRYVINQRMAAMKHNFKVEQNNDPREEVNLFEESCEVNEIYNLHDWYKILTSVWPANDIKKYWAITDLEDKCYETLKNFLSNIGGKLGRIFRAKPEWHTVSGLSLDIEVRKWETELKKKID